MLSARPGPLNPGATSPLSRHHLTRPSRAAGSFSGQLRSFGDPPSNIGEGWILLNNSPTRTQVGFRETMIQ